MSRRKKVKKLDLIMVNYRSFSHTVEVFIDSLRAKRDWKNLEEKLKDYKNKGWNTKNLEKIKQWERVSCSKYHKLHDRSLEMIKIISLSLNQEDMEDLRAWISSHNHSKQAHNRSRITIDDNEYIIKARMAHLIYMMGSASPINIGNLIRSDE